MDTIAQKDIEYFLEDFEKNSSTELVQATREVSELHKVAEARGIVIKGSRDLAVFKTIYAFTDRPNDNGAILPQKDLLKVLPQLVGKPVNINHNRRLVVGFYIDYRYIQHKNQIIAYGIFFKSNFGSEWKKAQELFAKRKLSSSFEIWNAKHLREYNSDGSFDMKRMEISGGALVYQDKDTTPAFAGSDVLEMAKTLDLESPELAYASKYKESEIMFANQWKESVEGNLRKLEAEKNPVHNMKCANCEHDFEVTDPVDVKCPSCFSILKSDGSVLYPPQVKDFNISCPSCRGNNWLITSSDDTKSQVKCQSCSKDFDITFAVPEKSELLDKVKFLYVSGTSCPQCGTEIGLSGTSDMIVHEVTCKKCSLAFKVNTEKLQRARQIKTIEEISLEERRKEEEMTQEKEKKEEETKVEEVKVEATPEVKAEEKVAETPEEPKAETKVAEKVEEPKSETPIVEEPTKEKATTEKEVVESSTEKEGEAPEAKEEKPSEESTEPSKDTTTEQPAETEPTVKEEAPKVEEPKDNEAKTETTPEVEKPEEKETPTEDKVEEIEVIDIDEDFFETLESSTKKHSESKMDKEYAIVKVVQTNGSKRKVRVFPLSNKKEVRSALSHLEVATKVLEKLKVSPRTLKARILKRAKQLGMTDLVQGHKATLAEAKYIEGLKKHLDTAVEKIVQLQDGKKLETAQANKSNKDEIAKIKQDADKKIEFAMANASQIVQRRLELGTYAKDISDKDIINDDVYGKVKLEKENAVLRAKNQGGDDVVSAHSEKDTEYFQSIRDEITRKAFDPTQRDNIV